MQSPKDKLNELLGISEDQTIDDFLSDLDVDVNQISSTLSSIDDNMKQTITKVDQGLSQLSCNVGEKDLITAQQVEESLGEIRSLIDISKRVVQHVYESICTSDLLDPELIQAMAKLIEATHINTADYIDLYKQRVAYYDKVKLVAFDHQNRMERIRLKHQLDMEKIQSKNIETAPKGMVSFDYENINKILDANDDSIQIND